MEVFFADDSTQKGAREGMGKLIAFGGLFLDESELKAFEDKVDSIASTAGLPDGTEIKWSPGHENWMRDNLHGDDRTKLFCDILSVAGSAGGRAIVVVLDEGRMVLEGARAFAEAAKYLFERVTTHLSKRDSHCIMVADRPGGGKKEEERFLSDFLKRVQDGTEWVRPEHVLLNILTTPSKLLRHLQLADVIVGATTAMVAGHYKYARPVFDQVQPMLITNYLDTVGGTGLKLFPDGLVNIYHWVLGEDTYWRVGMNTGWSLPNPDFPFAQDEYKAE